MGKRKHKDKRTRSHKKRKRHHRYSDSDSYTSSYEEDNYDYDHQQRDRYYELSDIENFDLPLSVSDDSVKENQPDENGALETPHQSSSITENPIPGPSAESTSLPAEDLEALGEPKSKEEVFGPKIEEEISKRWGRVLVDGLTKDNKQDLFEKIMIPENLRLAKAPSLNPELVPVISEPTRNRDNLLEKSQNQLGLGIAALSNLASGIAQGELDQIKTLKKISEISSILLDLHYDDTKRRRKLITSSLDKKFLYMVSDVTRDTYLFGDNLGEKIRAAKTAERSGLHVKRKSEVNATYNKRYPQQGNWRGPPRMQGARGHRQGGQRSRYWSQPQMSRRPPPPPNRPPRTPAPLNNKNYKP